MKVLIGCEESQAVCKAFRELGHEAYSCDIQKCSGGHPEWHYQDSIFHVLGKTNFSIGLDLFIGHPPCTYLANSGVRWLYNKDGSKNMERWERMEESALFFRSLLHTNAGGVCIENPIMHKHAMQIIGVKPSQIIQPWMFGHKETKATCLWLNGLPQLKETSNVKVWMDLEPDHVKHRIHRMPPGENRAKERSKTYTGIARAMAEQWGGKK